jgi:RNA polymerase sigma-70 factor, ECF subfamily
MRLAMTYPAQSLVRLTRMSRENDELPGIADETKVAWHRYLDVFEPLRPELYRYCRALTRSAFDAEDLVQDSLARGFVTLAGIFQEIRNPRAWLFRIASNLWIDRQRRHREDALESHAEQAAPETRPGEARDAGATLIGRLAPQERASVLLKDVFDFTLEEIAEMLTTTPNTIKAALHRGRGKLADAEPPRVRASSPVLDAFVEAFNARDIQRLTELMLDSTVAEIAVISTEYGPEKMKQSDTGSLHHTLFSPLTHAVQAAFLNGYKGGTPRAELRTYREEPVMLCWYDHDDGPKVRDTVRLELRENRVANIRYYFFSPDALAEVCRELGVPWQSNGYRYWS